MTLTTRRLATAILFVGLFAMATRVAVDSDTFWHLRAGAWIVEHRQVLTHDEFSHTVSGRSWQYPAWLTEAVMYWLFSRGGYGALALFTALFVTLTFAFVYVNCEGGVYLKAWVVILAAASSSVFWSARPHIVTLALGAATLYILDLYRRRNINRLWLLPVFMALWSNVHPGFAVGLIFIGLTATGESIKAAFATDRLAWCKPAWLVGVGLACVLALLISPYGVNQLLFPFRTVSSGLLQNYIQEWQSPNFHIKEAQIFIWLLLVAVAAVGLSRRQLDMTDLLLMSICIYLALIASRNIALFSLVAAPIITRHIQAALDDLAERYPRLKSLTASPPPSPRMSALNWAILILILIAALVKISIPLDSALNERIIENSLPVNAGRYVAQTRPAGLLFNPYNWGGYLAWALYPNYAIYVDGRTDLYGDDFFAEYLQVASGAPDWEKVLVGRGVRLLIVETGSPLATSARRDPDWLIRYSDRIAVVFERR